MSDKMPPADFQALKARLATGEDRLPKRLKQVASALVAQPDDIAFSTAAEVSARIGVQPSTLVRFAQALGYSGFSELQEIFRARLKERFPDYRERLETLQGCVQALQEPYATAIDLVYRDGQPLDRVAETVRENVETVKKRVQRARAMIAECLHRKGAFA